MAGDPSFPLPGAHPAQRERPRLFFRFYISVRVDETPHHAPDAPAMTISARTLERPPQDWAATRPEPGVMRPPAAVTSPRDLGAYKACRFSFVRRFVRRIVSERWRIERARFDLDGEGRG